MDLIHRPEIVQGERAKKLGEQHVEFNDGTMLHKGSEIWGQLRHNAAVLAFGKLGFAGAVVPEHAAQ